MNNKNINLDVITKQYRNTGAASKGYKTVNKLIKEENIIGLSILLRNHKLSPIEAELEIKERDNIDFLIDYYSILEIGLLSDYLPNPLPVNLETEIEIILGNKYINTYFSKYYPQILPQILLKQIRLYSTGEYLNRKLGVESKVKFDRFLLLRQIIKMDSDIDQFLWFLDDGWTHGYSISDFWNVLSNENIIRYKLGSKNKHPLNKAMWGFIKYIQFLSDFADLLKNCNDDLTLQSAFWHHQSYWFEHMKERIGDIIIIGISNIRKSMSEVNSNRLSSNKNSFLKTEDDISKWRNEEIQLNGIEEDINYLINGNIGQPLIELFNQIGK